MPNTSRYSMSAYLFLALTLCIGGTIVTGCKKQDAADAQTTVVLYCSTDRPFAERVVADFEKETGINVKLKSDKELTKTTGLVRLVRAEKHNPKADVFWSSELYNTIKLAEDGLLAEYRPAVDDIDDRYKDPAGKWTAIALRGRVLAYNPSIIDKEQLPKTWREIASSNNGGDISVNMLGVANPKFGTTSGHFAAFLALWGEDDYRDFLNELKIATAGTWMPGNATAAQNVAQGKLAICATDTDDVIVRQRKGMPIDMIFPDMGDGGTLLIPNSVALIANGPNPDAGKRLVNYLVSAHVERMLALSDSSNYPVRAKLREELNMPLPAESKLTYQQIADAMDKAIQLAGDAFID